jgi:uncharacterized membrane protein
VHALLLFIAVFAASAVEMIEALTIVLAVGVTRGWRSALTGVAAAVVALAVVVGALGPALSELPIDGVRLVVGALLLIFGLQWLRKAILRSAGLKAMHDEEAIYRAEIADLEESRGVEAHDWYSFTVAFKGVFLEGLEVAFIVVTLGGSQHDVALAAIGAGAALIAVLAAGVVVYAPLSRVPENTLKFAVGVMLTTFGAFWGGEGAGVRWPGGDVALLGLLLFVALAALSLVRLATMRAPAGRSGVTAS